MDKNSFIHGLQVGSLIAGMRRVTKKPVAYLYNGVQLPPLPDWDKQAYPYVFMMRFNVGIFGGWRIRVSAFSQPNHRIMIGTDGGYYCGVKSGEKYLNLICNESELSGSFPNFEEIEATKDGIISNDQIWTNYDILNADGTRYLAASDPIPVYE